MMRSYGESTLVFFFVTFVVVCIRRSYGEANLVFFLSTEMSGQMVA